MKRFIPFLTLLMISCSHVHEATKVVELPFANDLLVEMQRGHRSPASLLDTEEGKSYRRIYFSALYHQYLTLGQHLGKDQDLRHCPQFHHDKIENDARIRPLVTLYSTKSLQANREFFPELAFTSSFSVSDYYNTLGEEVRGLCEEGTSDNYYKFDNLINYHVGKMAFHKKPEAMRALLNIPVFANYYLLKMIQSPQGPYIVHPEEKKLIEVGQVHWFERYVARAHQVRNEFLKNKTVQR
jgi:hypothetical protein